MIQLRYDVNGFYPIMEELGLEWIHLNREFEREWSENLTRIIDALTQWCKDSGIKPNNFSFGHTQIDLCVTFLEKKDAALFKLRWQGGQGS